jgi:uncharacterized protein with LGFP repeats
MTAIDDKYAGLGGNAGLLGAPLDVERPTADGVGRFRAYLNGSLYWSPTTGAHEVHGAIRDKWSQLQAERGFLGYPLTDDATPADGIGRFNSPNHKHTRGGLR